MSAETNSNVSVEFLKNYPQFLDPVAEWLFSEWGDTFLGSSLTAARDRVSSRMKDKEIPLTMIALLDGELVGTASIKIDDMDTRPELTPWLAGVYVKDGMRDRGIGSALVRGVEETAIKLGVQKLYLFTPNRRSFYERMGWTFFEETEYRGKQVTILAKTFS